jgi:AcrR family transcriptional regulator
MSYPAEHRRLTKQKIVRSARRLFDRRGFEAVSIDDVMADAGLTRGSFYSYFESKGDLYAEAITERESFAHGDAERMRGPRCGRLRVRLVAPTSQAAALFYGRLFEAGQI